MNAWIALAAVLVTLACGRSTNAEATSAQITTAPKPASGVEAKRYTVRGVIKNIDVAKKRVSIAHEDIPGFMNAMTMPFDVKDASLLTGLAVGDAVSFSFTVDDGGNMLIDRIEKAK